jgi:hypothetical protein
MFHSDNSLVAANFNYLPLTLTLSPKGEREELLGERIERSTLN